MKTSIVVWTCCLSAALLAAQSPAHGENAPAAPEPALSAAAPPDSSPPAKTPPATPPKTSVPEAKAQSGRYLNLVLRDSPIHRATMLGLVRGKQNVPFWVRGIVSNPVYVSGASQQVEINGRSFELFSACSPKVCADSNLKLLFTADGKAAWLRILDPATGERFFGEPSPDQRLLLEKSGL
jgi:hypothetical protein